MTAKATKPNEKLPPGTVGGWWATRPMHSVRFVTILRNQARD